MPTDHPPEPSGDALPPEDDAYAPPAELDEQASQVRDGHSAPGDAPPPRRFPGLKLGLVVAGLAIAAAALLAYRSIHRSRVLAEGAAKAESLLRLDTAAGYREAAALLEPLAGLDPLEAGSMRAFALAMLAADYRDAAAEAQAEALLVEPGRAERVPVYADLASAALFLGRRAVGDATTYAGRARRSPWGGALQGRLALLAGNPEAGFEPVAAATAADPKLAAALAVQGDLARRARQDGAAARTAYAAALASSPAHPRAAYGLAKLALSGQIPLAEAMPPLRHLLAEQSATPRVERARAALLLAAVELRSGDRAGASAALEAAGLDPAARTWADRAAAVLAAERRPYRAVLDAPPSLQSPSDDDPAELSSVPPPPPAPPPAPVAKPAVVAKSRATAKPAPKAAAKPGAKAVPKVAAKPVAKPVVKPAAKKAAAPAAKPASR
jgi:hypothetical protein